MNTGTTRLVPELPPAGSRMRLLIDTDIATEIDDLYAVSLALRSPDRFALEGMVGTHFAQKAGRKSIDESYALLGELLEQAGMPGAVAIARGGDPLRYPDEPSDSEGARLLIERARAGSADDPLWVVGLGAASTMASAIMLDPEIAPLVRFVFHARSEQTWPRRSEQYNVAGDIWAARILLCSNAPLVWFDTGSQLVSSMEMTERRLSGSGRLGRYLHEYRNRKPYYQSDNKGFFDLGDIAWMIDPSICTNDVVDAPHMDWAMIFRHDAKHGKMLRVHDIRPEPTWDIFFDRMAAGADGGTA